jgi:hypothetical protein
MQKLIEKLKKQQQNVGGSIGYLQGIEFAIDLIRAEMPLTVRELAEHLQKKDPSRQKNIEKNKLK